MPFLSQELKDIAIDAVAHANPGESRCLTFDKPEHLAPRCSIGHMVCALVDVQHLVNEPHHDRELWVRQAAVDVFGLAESEVSDIMHVNDIMHVAELRGESVARKLGKIPVKGQVEA